MVQPVIFLDAVKRFLQPRACRGAFLQSQCLELGEYWNQSRGRRQKPFCPQKKIQGKEKEGRHYDVCCRGSERYVPTGHYCWPSEISLLKVKACRWIIFPHWIPLGQVICTISPQVQWWLVLKEFQTTVSMHQVKCINNPGAMRQIPTQLGQPTTAYEIISDKTVYFSRFFL